MLFSVYQFLVMCQMWLVALGTGLFNSYLFSVCCVLDTVLEVRIQTPRRQRFHRVYNMQEIDKKEMDFTGVNGFT